MKLLLALPRRGSRVACLVSVKHGNNDDETTTERARSVDEVSLSATAEVEEFLKDVLPPTSTSSL